MPQAVENKRRTPSQTRSIATVETILEAVAQILESGRAGQFTTNRVAERAGYSIGTLYNYFPHKRSLLEALVKREVERQEIALTRLIQADPDLPTASLVRSILRSALRPFDDRRGLQRALIGLLFSQQDIVDGAMAVGDRLMPLLASRLALGQPAPDIDPIARQATLGAVIGAVLALGRHDPDVLQLPHVEDELVRLLLHGLRAA